MSRKKKILLLLASITLIVAFFFPKNSTNCDYCIGSETLFFCGITSGSCVLYCSGIPYSCQQAPSASTPPTSTITETSIENWKTFRNEEIGILLRYPPDLKANRPYRQAAELMTADFENTNYKLKVGSIIGPSPESTQEILNNFSSLGEKVKVNNLQATKVTYDREANKSVFKKESKDITIYTLSRDKDNLVYISLEYIKGEDDKNYEAIFDQILSTFQFLE